MIDRPTPLIATWCRLCGVEHSPEENCPRAAICTERESEGWRVSVETPHGAVGYGVIVAQVGSRWRARIMTYPNVLWMVPGGGETIKFLGRSREESIAKAKDFVRGHCVRRGYLMRDEIACVPAALSVRTNAPPHATNGGAGAPRFDQRLPVMFGSNRPTLNGETLNLSESGLFITTDLPMSFGDLVGMSLDLDYCKVPLRGSVAWRRPLPRTGLPGGMGLSLLEPPTIYVSYVRALD